MIAFKDTYYAINNEYNMDDEKFIKLLQKSKELNIKERTYYFEQLETVVKQMSLREDRKKKLKKIWS